MCSPRPTEIIPTLCTFTDFSYTEIAEIYRYYLPDLPRLFAFTEFIPRLFARLYRYLPRLYRYYLHLPMRIRPRSAEIVCVYRDLPLRDYVHHFETAVESVENTYTISRLLSRETARKTRETPPRTINWNPPHVRFYLGVEELLRFYLGVI